MTAFAKKVNGDEIQVGNNFICDPDYVAEELVGIINAAHAEAVKPLVQALEKIGKLAETNDRNLDDYGKIARKALEDFQ